MTRTVLKADFFWPLALLCVFILGLLAAGGLALVEEFDRAATQREESVVENGLLERIHDSAWHAAQEVVWDSAVEHLDDHFDDAWASQNIGVIFGKSLGFEKCFILDAENRPLFAADAGLEVDAHNYEAFRREAQSLVTMVRALEIERGPIHNAQSGANPLPEPILANSVANVSGRLYILTAALIQPDFGSVLPRGPRAPMVVSALRIDQGFLSAFAERFLLRGLVLHLAAYRPHGDEAEVVLHNDRGERVASLTWVAQGSGEMIMRRLGWIFVPVLLCLAAGVLILYRRSRRMALGLISSEARAAHLAYHDALTGLPNRVLFFDRLGHSLSQMRRSGEVVAVHCIDIDRLKDVNDTFGHHVGDELIREAARRMAGQCRSSDTFARLSGDEFAIVQTRASVGAGAALAARLTEAMARPFELTTGRVFVGCSVGISIVADPHLDPPEALRQADVALYRAKQTAKGQFCFFEQEMDAQIKVRRGLESDLREALANNDFTLAYQPQFHDDDGMTGVEALVRWCHPTRGNISPAFFVPIAEECGLIMELGMFILRRAFEDSKRWGGLKVAINVSAKQLRMRDFVARVVELTTEIGVDPHQFELEITEGILLGDDLETHEMLEQLRRLGFSLALDDFGTGYSSLSYLQRYPIDKIKIDRSFIANLGVESESEAVIAAIVKLAQALNLSVIAEGVETIDQHERLSMAGCHDMQGYLFSKPIDADAIDALISRTSDAAPEAADERMTA